MDANSDHHHCYGQQPLPIFGFVIAGEKEKEKNHIKKRPF